MPNQHHRYSIVEIFKNFLILMTMRIGHAYPTRNIKVIINYILENCIYITYLFFDRIRNMAEKIICDVDDMSKKETITLLIKNLNDAFRSEDAIEYVSETILPQYDWNDVQ